MKLEELKKDIPFKWRVQSFSQFKAEATCVAYIDARDVEDLLDEVCGMDNWACEYYEMKGNLFCRIGIATDKCWVWKSDCGSETAVEAEKGEASDAFKRAAVKWGIGRFLYRMKMHKVEASEIKTKTNKPYVVFNGNRIWDLTKHINRIGDDIPVEAMGGYKKVTEKVTSQAPELTEKQIFVLKKNDKWVEGMSFRDGKAALDEIFGNK